MIVSVINERQTGNTLSYVATANVRCTACGKAIPQGNRYTRKQKQAHCQSCRPFERAEEEYAAQVRRANKLIEQMARPRK